VITTIVAEDEAPQRAHLCALLAEIGPDFRVAAECSDGIEALEALATHRPQVIFLDIRMPGASGLDVARAASGAHIIFTTAYEEYALQAFDQGAIDYLLKPVSADRLSVALIRVRERLKTGSTQDLSAIINLLEERLATRRGAETIKWVTASTGNTAKMFAIDDVLFFQAQDKYTRVVTLEDEALIRAPLKELVSELDPDQFWHVHRSVIVRVNAIQSVRRGEDGKLTLRIKGRGDELPVSSALSSRFRGM
jgi:DNA-binding LytR/AlgR family response regulator